MANRLTLLSNRLKIEFSFKLNMVVIEIYHGQVAETLAVYLVAKFSGIEQPDCNFYVYRNNKYINRHKIDYIVNKNGLLINQGTDDDNKNKLTIRIGNNKYTIKFKYATEKNVPFSIPKENEYTDYKIFIPSTIMETNARILGNMQSDGKISFAELIALLKKDRFFDKSGTTVKNDKKLIQVLMLIAFNEGKRVHFDSLYFEDVMNMYLPEICRDYECSFIRYHYKKHNKLSNFTTCNIGALINWLKQDYPIVSEYIFNPSENFAKCYNNTEENLNNFIECCNDLSISNRCAKYDFTKNVKITSAMSLECYIYNDSECLWKLSHKEKICVMMLDPVLLELERYKCVTDKNIKEEKNKETRLFLKKRYTSIVNAINKVSNMATNEKLPRLNLTEFYDEHFLKHKNQLYKNLLPIANNKIINLQTLEITGRKRQHYFTTTLDVDYGNPEHPVIIKYINELFVHHLEIVPFFQKLMGYCLTADVEAKVAIYLIGGGDNGKSKFIKLFNKCIKEFQGTAHSSVFESKGKKNDVLNPSLAALIDKRVIEVSETSEGKNTDAELIKAMTGGDPITVRGLHKDPITIDPISKPMIITNFPPLFNINDLAMLARMMIIPFDTYYGDKIRGDDNKAPDFPADKTVIDNIENNHLNDLFAWICVGAKRYYDEGLKDVPDSINAAINKLVSELDTIDEFIQGFVTFYDEKDGDKNAYIKYNTVRADQFNRTYKKWCEEYGKHKYKQMHVKAKMINKYKVKTTSDKINITYVGIDIASIW